MNKKNILSTSILLDSFSVYKLIALLYINMDFKSLIQKLNCKHICLFLALYEKSSNQYVGSKKLILGDAF